MKKLALVLAMLLVCAFAMASCGGSDGSAGGSNIAAEFAAGKIENGVYTNDSLGLVFTPSASLTMMTQEEIEASLNLGSDMLDVEVDTSNTNITYEMMASNMSTGASVSMISEKLPTAMSASEYVAASTAGIKQTMGDVEIKESTAQLAGINWNVIAYTLDVQGMTYTSTQYVCVAGDYAVIISFGDIGTGISDLIACFSAK